MMYLLTAGPGGRPLPMPGDKAISASLARLLQSTGGMPLAPPALVPQPDEPVTDTIDATREPGTPDPEQAADDLAARDATRPAPADPAGTPREPGAPVAEGAGEGGTVPPHAPPAGSAGAAPAPTRGAAAPAAGPAPAIEARSPDGVVASARATVAALPLPPGGAPARTAAPARPPPARTAAVRRIPGPPPVPMAEPEFADIIFPLPDTMARLETVANRTLPQQTMPVLEASPGGHMPIVPDRLTGDSMRRMVIMGEPAMDRAGLSRPGDPATAADPNPGGDRTMLLDLRTRLLTPPERGADGRPVAPVVPPALTTTPIVLPPATLTVAERDLMAAVIARLITDTSEKAREIVHDIKDNMPGYPDKQLNHADYPLLTRLGDALVPGIADRIGEQGNALARSIGAAGAILDDAVAANRQRLANIATADAVAAAGGANDALASSASVANARLADAAVARDTATDAREQAWPGRRPRPGFRQQAEAAVARVQARVSEGIAGFRLQGIERKAELDGLRDRLIAAYDMAVGADELAAQRQASLAPDQTPPSDPDQLSRARAAVSAAITTATRWRDARVSTLRSSVDGMKAAVDATVNANVSDIETEGAAAFRDIRSWGATQDGAAEEWWTTLATNLDTWATNAHATATTWADAEARLARMQMQRDMQRIGAQLASQMAEGSAEARAFAEMSEERRRDFIARFLASPGGEGPLASLATHATTRVREGETAAARTAITAEIDAIPQAEWQTLEFLAKARNPEFDASARANAIRSAGVGDRWGTNEATIFRQLERLRPIELKAVTGCYGYLRGSATALYDDLDSELSGDEWQRAKDLMQGGPEGTIGAIVEAVHDAAWGPGTGEAQIMEALRTLDALPEAERANARARLNEVYQDRYGTTLDAVLASEMDTDGSEWGQANALVDGRLGDADAYEMGTALGDRDAGAAASVYERIRTETMARARSEGLTPAEAEAIIAERNRDLSDRFGTLFPNTPSWGGSGTALDNATGNALWRSPEQWNMLRAYQSGDTDAVDAHRMAAERNSNYADDEVMGGVVKAQFDRGHERASLELGPELRAGLERRLAAEAARTPDDARPPMTPRQYFDRRMALEREMNNRITDAGLDHARTSTAALDARLQARYGMTLDRMISDTMSDNVFGQGGDLTIARERLRVMRTDARDLATDDARRSRRLDYAYLGLRHAMEGAGTDNEGLQSNLRGHDRADMEELDRRWRRDHGEETLIAAIEDDTSGRLEGDLVELVTHGAPTTAEQRVAELRRRLERDDRGAGIAEGADSDVARSRTLAREELARLEAINLQLDDRSASPDRRAQLMSSFETHATRLDTTIEGRRAAVDSFADSFTQLLQYVIGAVALVLGAIAAVVTGGAAVPALIAIAGSVLGTLSGMAAKAAIKGAAYGAEEFATDAVIGAVDLVVTIASVGALKGSSFWAKEGGRTIVGAAREGLRTAGRSTARQLLGRAFTRATVTRASIEAGEELAEGAARRTLASRALGAGGRFFAGIGEEMVESLPSTIAASVMNEDNWRHGNPFANMARSTWDSTISGLPMMVGMSGAGHLLNHGLGRTALGEHPPLADLDARARDLRFNAARSPDSSTADLVARLETEQAGLFADADALRTATRAARSELLSTMPPAVRGTLADVPILHVGEAQFRALNGGNFGDATVVVREGQAFVIVRNGAPPVAVRGLASDLQGIVAPHSGGRTVNPADSLPPRLRNRVDIEPVSDPSLGDAGVRAVPRYDGDGHVVGVTLQVGPNATSAMIQRHIGTVDAMRRYAGLAGRARLLLGDMAQALGFDVVNPRERTRGQWYAALEIAKLPAIIEARMLDLGSGGLDPRRRGIIEADVESLHRQISEARARYELGPEGPTADGVAASSSRRKRPAEVSDASAAASAANRARAEVIAAELNSKRPRLQSLEGRIDSLIRPPENMAKAVEAHIERLVDVMPESHPHHALVEEIRVAFMNDPEAGMALIKANADLIGRLTNQYRFDIGDAFNRREPGRGSQQGEIVAGTPDYSRGFGPADILRRVTDFEAAVTRRNAELGVLQAEIGPLRDRVNMLDAEFNDLRLFAGTALDAKLPDPVSGWDYKIEEGFAAKLGDDAARVLAAVMDSIEGRPKAFDDLLAVATASGNVKMAENLVKLRENVLKQHNGHVAEVRLANQIVQTFDQTVIEFGHGAGVNGADVVSVVTQPGKPPGLPVGTVVLWDSKYRSGASAPAHSDTFTNDGKREKALVRARKALADAHAEGRSGLSDSDFAAAMARLDPKNPNVIVITSHTSGGGFSHRARRYQGASNAPQASPWNP
jgi:hypothetical protein